MRLLVPVALALSAIVSGMSARDSHTPAAPQDGRASAMFRNGPEHLGVYSSGSPSLSTVAWKFKTGGRVISSPLVVGDVVYVGSTDNFLYAINRGDGSLKWKFETRGAVNSSPAYSDGVVFVNSLDGKLYAVDAAMGQAKWSFATKGERRFTAPGIHGAMPRTERMPDPFDVFLSSPTVAGGVVYFGSGDNNVYALDAATGAQRWSFKTGDVVHASPAVANGVVYIGSWDSYMYAIDAASGTERWRFKTGIDTVIYNQVGIASSAAVTGGVVYFGCRDGHFYAVDAASGTMKWKHDNKMGWTIASPAVTNGVVYFPTSDGTRFKALDAATGDVKFSNVMKTISFSSPAIAGNVVYYGTSDGWLHAVDITTGAMKAEFQTDGSKANGARYIDSTGRMNTGPMYPDRTLDGMMIGMRTMMTLGSILSSPSVAGGVVYVGSTDGNVYALR